ncbi:hypothetical protein ACHAWF_003785 [Thalassiosira exigua]
MFGIWIDDGSNAWLNFKAETNNFGILSWEFEEPSTSVDFLDLTISIEDRQVRTKTFQKSINLYQYLPPQSAHPPSMMHGIIYSLMKNYRRQNSRQADYEDVAIKLFKRHVARGWDGKTINQFILDADAKLTKKCKVPQLSTPPPSASDLSLKERIFVQWEYHPKDIPRKQIQAIYGNTLKDNLVDTLGIKQTTIAFPRLKNIRE